MHECHGFDLSATPAFHALEELVRVRLAQPPDQAAVEQPDFERRLRTAMAEVERAVHVEDLSRLDVEHDGLVVDGVRYRRVPEKTRGLYETLAGQIEVKRSLYRARGGHGGATICPLEMRVGILGGSWTPLAAEVASQFMATAPSQEAAELLESVGGMTPSPAHLDRLPKAFNRAWEADRARFEAALRTAESERLPALAVVALILVSLDGVMVPMKDAPRTPGAGKQDCGPKGYQEAACGTLALFDAAGNRLHTIRVARMPESKKVVLQAQLTAELAWLVERYPDAKLQAVADGADENWRIIEEIATELQVTIEPVLDYFHAVEHIDEGLRRHAGRDQEQASADIRYWHGVLRDDPQGVHKVLRALEYRARKASGTKRDDILQQFNYIDKRKGMMAYARLRQENRPIGSGIQEAACKTLVAQRMKRSGMTWRHPGGQGILTLRSLQQSDRAHDAWNILRPAFRKDFTVDEDRGRLQPLRQAA